MCSAWPWNLAGASSRTQSASETSTTIRSVHAQCERSRRGLRGAGAESGRGLREAGAGPGKRRKPAACVLLRALHMRVRAGLADSGSAWLIA